MKKISCILLIDDNPSANFLHRKLIEKSGKAEHIYEVENALDGLDFIEQKGKFNENLPSPNIIFLDINMPIMDGFEFLEHYAKLPKSKQTSIVIVFVSTSNWEKDRIRAIENDLVHDFIEKPLVREELETIMGHYIKVYNNKLVTT